MFLPRQRNRILYRHPDSRHSCKKQPSRLASNKVAQSNIYSLFSLLYLLLMPHNVAFSSRCVFLRNHYRDFIQSTRPSAKDCSKPSVLSDKFFFFTAPPLVAVHVRAIPDSKIVLELGEQYMSCVRHLSGDVAAAARSQNL